MRLWPWVVAILYAVVLFFLLIPLAFISMQGKPETSPSAFFSALKSLPLPATLLVMVIAQYALLRVPVQISARRPEALRSLWATHPWR